MEKSLNQLYDIMYDHMGVTYMISCGFKWYQLNLELAF